MALIYSKADKAAIDRAVAKARQVKPHVKPLGFGRFEVQGSESAPYIVEFGKNSTGEFEVSCTCKANSKGSKPCYHAAACGGVFKKQVADRAVAKAALEVLETPAPEPEPTCYCSECGTEHLASLNICPGCGFNYITRRKPDVQKAYDDLFGAAPVLRERAKEEW